MFERFSYRVRKALVLAQEESQRLGSSFLGTEHILLGLILEEEGVAGHILAGLGITYTKALAAIKELNDRPVENLERLPFGPPFTPRAKKVLELSLREALQLGHSYIDTEHVLMAIGREGEGIACQTLVSLGHEPSAIRKAVINRLAGITEPVGAPSESTIEKSDQVTLVVPPLSREQAKRLQDWIVYRGIARSDHPIYPIAVALNIALDD